MNCKEVKKGMTFGEWKIISPMIFKRASSKKWYHLCRCSCGIEKAVNHGDMNNGKSGRCYDCHIKWMKIHKPAFKDGGKNKRLKKCFYDMMSRCYNTKDGAYVNYGGRGIKVWKKWHDINIFMEWAMHHGYASDLTIERRNVNHNYNPENCCFVTLKKQNRNKRNSRYWKAFGEEKIMIEWSEDERCKVSFSTLNNRLRRGWEVEDALSFSKNSGSSYTKRKELK